MHLYLYAWVDSQTSIGFPVDGAIKSFLVKKKISEDELSLEAAKTIYYRIQKEEREGEHGGT
jgi:hypothetical protein